MKPVKQIRQAFLKLHEAAQCASSTGDRESFEALSMVEMGLGWVLGYVDPTAGVNELLKGAEWARQQARKAPEN